MSNELKPIPVREIDDAVVEAQTRAYDRLTKRYLVEGEEWLQEDIEPVRNLLQILHIAKEMGVY